MGTPTIEASLDRGPARLARRQTLRLQMLGVVAASYAVDAIILLLYARAGTTAPRIALLFALAGGAICAIVFVVFRRGIGVAGDDPFLSVWQTVPGVAVQIGFVLAAPEVAVVFLNVLFIVVGFGTLRLAARDAAIVWGLTSLGAGAAIAVAGSDLRIPVSTAEERLITGLCFALTLGRCAATGVLGNTYRALLSERTEALRRMTANLEVRIAEIKTLQGILPICSYCKKIRDDRGAWNQLEAYISTHADVAFSHGICAECLKTHHPDVT